MQKPIYLVGNNTKFFFGNPPNNKHEILNTSNYKGIVNYDPSELVVVVRSGTSIKELEKVLNLKNQTLGFDPPRFDLKEKNNNKFVSGGTVGGMVATGLAGPKRIFNGSCREAVLGLSVLNSNGELLKFGGNVIKNVAGYDISRLHVGAMGSLGLILDVSLRVKPLPSHEETLALPASYLEMMTILESLFSDHLPISSTSWSNIEAADFFNKEMLVIRLSGAVKSVEKAKDYVLNCQKKAFVVEKDKANSYWNFLRDQRFSFFTDKFYDSNLWRVSLPFGNNFTLFDRQNQWVEWGGALRWIKTDEDPKWVFALIKRYGGNAMIYKVGEKFSQIQDRLAMPDWIEKDLHMKIKKKMDPKFIFNPGRLYSFL